MELKEYPFWPYPNDWPTRVGFILGDIVALVVVVGMILIPLRSVFRL